MTVVERKPLFDLLPAIYRIRDAEGDGSLQALLSIVDDQIDVIEGDIATLYDDWFIETCAEWLVPYIGDLLGVRNLQEIPSAKFSRRAYVANTLAYRRRKGTLAVLEQLAKDVTGWSAKGVEFFELLSTTQYLNHLRDHNLPTLDLRSPDIDQVGTAFETAAHTGEVRSIASRRGRYNILNIGIYLWTLQPYEMYESEARHFGPGDFRFFFEPVDLSALTVALPLLNSPEAESEIADLAEEVNVAGTVRRRALHDELEALRQAITDGTPEEERTRPVWFDISPVLQVRVGSESEPIPPEEIVICDLSADSAGAWRRPSDQKSYLSTSPGAGTVASAGSTVTGTGTAFDDYFQMGDSIAAGDQTIAISSIGSATGIQTTAPFNPPLPAGSTYRRSRPHDIRVGVDPELGRIVLASGENHSELRVGYSYGFSGDIGAGPYDRRDSPEQWFEPPVTIETGLDWHVGVSKDPDPPAMAPNKIFSTLGDAIDEWKTVVGSLGTAPVGLISIMDNSTYDETLTGADKISTPMDGTLIIAAAEWPATEDAAGNVQPRKVGRVEPVGLRPHILGDIEVDGEATGTGDGGRVILDGLLIEGQVTILPGKLRRFSVAHCTFVPTRGGLLVRTSAVDGDNEDLSVELLRTITGPIRAPATIESVEITDSIVDAAGDPYAISGPASTVGSTTTVIRSTVLGRTKVRQVELGSDSIFTKQVRTERTQHGCLRFSYLPRDPDPHLDSRTPRRYRCQPDLALATETAARGLNSVQDLPADVASAIRSRVRPIFTDIDYGRPGYTQLMPVTVPEIGTGAENESEMGVWSHLMRPQRLGNLRTALDEYLRFGLEAGSILVT